MIPPEKLLWPPSKIARPQGLLWRQHSVAHFLQRQGQWVQLHCVLRKHSTALWEQAIASLGPWENVAKEATQMASRVFVVLVLAPVLPYRAPPLAH